MAERLLCVVLHDVAGSTQAACERAIGAIEQVAALPLTLLAVPRYHHEVPPAAFEHWLGMRQRHGDEIALHGYTHQDDGTPRGWPDRLRRRIYTRGEGEFCDLDEREAETRLRAGIEWFERNGWTLHGFVAPAWLIGGGSWGPLQRLGFDYTCSLRRIHLLREQRTITSQSLVYSTSSAARRQMSRVWNAGVARAERDNPVLRFELHPRDADYPQIRRSWQGLLARHLEGRRPVTLAQLGAHTAPVPPG